MNQLEKLSDLYRNVSKHSNYQELPSALKPYFEGVHLSHISRHENARLEFFKKYISFNQKSLLDIGANTGFFSFEFLHNGVESVTVYEGNKSHSEFIKTASSLLGLESKIKVFNEYFDVSNPPLGCDFDIILLLNVLHHIGDDFGYVDSIDQAKLQVAQSLRSFSKMTKKIIFQLGYNWMGNKNLPLFTNGTKVEQIDFVSEIIEGFWTIDAIGVAEMVDDIVSYNLPTNTNLRRQDALGEFLNRPLFILSSVRSADDIA